MHVPAKKLKINGFVGGPRALVPCPLP